MKRDTRGFRYALEPLQRQREWALEGARAALAQACRGVEECERRVETLEVRLAVTRAEWNRRAADGGGFTAQAQQVAMAYAADLYTLIKVARQALDVSRQVQEQAIELVMGAQREVEVVAAHREQSVKEFELKRAGGRMPTPTTIG